jgi:hypothetical protein
MSTLPSSPKDEKHEQAFSSLDGRQSNPLPNDEHSTSTVLDLVNADEALAFLTNHPHAAELAIQGNAILDDPVELKKLVRKIDVTIAPLLAAVYFLQFLDKTTLSYTAVMGIRADTHLVGQDYSNLSMLFYIGMFALHSPKTGWRIKNESRVPGSGVSDAVFGSAYLAVGVVSWS